MPVSSRDLDFNVIYVVVRFVFSEFRGEVIVRYLDGINNHNYLFKISFNIRTLNVGLHEPHYKLEGKLMYPGNVINPKDKETKLSYFN